MGALDWVSLPKLRVTQVMDKWLSSLSNRATQGAFGGAYGKASGNQTSFSHRFKPLSHDKPF
ncbi:MAG: hypothetical protein WC717_02635 [Candidatus Micrarchaeia archaeon]